MDEINIRIGDKIKIFDDTFRIIGMQQGLTSLIALETDKTIITTKKTIELVDLINTLQATIIPREIDNRYFSKEDMTEEMAKINDLKRNVMNDVITEFGPMFIELKTDKGTRFVKKLESDGIMKKFLFWKTVREFLQSGMNENSLIDKRLLRKINDNYNYNKKTGTPSKLQNNHQVIITDNEKKYFDEAVKDYFSGRTKTLIDSYDGMILKHYTKLEETAEGAKYGLVPIAERPSIDQFKYYYYKTISKEDVDAAKTSKREQRNNQRLLLSDNLKDVTGPGSLWEVDECEMDLFLVSEDDPTIVVGRPIVYVMIDIYTRMIVAYSVSFENNSVKGITNCFISLIENKKELCKKFGINIDDLYWPDHILPQRLRSDYGSEYTSYEMERICKELGIQHELASPATGSMKGQVEQLFHQIHSAINPITEHNGLIEKRYDSTHKKDATLNIKEFEEMLLSTIIIHNKQYMKDYPRTKDMMRRGVKPIPENLWAYGINKMGNPRIITNDSTFKFSLLTPITVCYSRKGISYKGLYFMDFNDELLKRELYKLGNRKKNVEARIDQRCIDNVYVLRDKEILSIPLNEEKTGMSDFKGMSLKEYQDLYEKITVERLEGNQYNNENRIALLSKNLSIVQDSNGIEYHPSAKNLQENRAAEKEKISKKQLIVGSNKTSETKPIDKIPSENKKSKNIDDLSFEEVLEEYENFEREYYMQKVR